MIYGVANRTITEPLQVKLNFLSKINLAQPSGEVRSTRNENQIKSVCELHLYELSNLLARVLTQNYQKDTVKFFLTQEELEKPISSDRRVKELASACKLNGNNRKLIFVGFKILYNIFIRLDKRRIENLFENSMSEIKMNNFFHNLGQN